MGGFFGAAFVVLHRFLNQFLPASVGVWHQHCPRPACRMPNSVSSALIVWFLIVEPHGLASSGHRQAAAPVAFRH